MKYKLVLLAVALIFHAVSSKAMPLEFLFSFNDVINGTAVTGIVRGLQDDVAGQAAGSVEVLTSTGGFGIGEYVSGPGVNQWDVAAGDITYYAFASFGVLNTLPAVVCCSLYMWDGLPVTPDKYFGLANHPSAIAVNQGPVAFEPVATPATITLFSIGFAGLGISRWKRKVHS